MLKRKKKAKPDFSRGFTTWSISCFLPYILTGILKTEKNPGTTESLCSPPVFPHTLRLSIYLSVRYFSDLPYISRHREIQDIKHFLSTANIRVDLWVRNTSFIWKQEEADAWTQIGRFPLESINLCQYMPCFSFAKSLLLIY